MVVHTRKKQQKQQDSDSSDSGGGNDDNDRYCEALTKEGSPCTAFKQKGKLYCYIHRKYSSSSKSGDGGRSSSSSRGRKRTTSAAVSGSKRKRSAATTAQRNREQVEESEDEEDTTTSTTTTTAGKEADDTEYLIEKLVQKSMLNKKAYYLVKWYGYDTTDNTWEPEENLPSLLVADYNRNYTWTGKRKSARKRKKRMP